MLFNQLLSGSARFGLLRHNGVEVSPSIAGSNFGRWRMEQLGNVTFKYVVGPMTGQRLQWLPRLGFRTALSCGIPIPKTHRTENNNAETDRDRNGADNSATEFRAVVGRLIHT